MTPLKLAALALVAMLAVGCGSAATPTPKPSPSQSPSPSPVCTTSAAKGTCGPYDYPQMPGTTDAGPTVGQDVWNPIPGWQQTLTATDRRQLARDG